MADISKIKSLDGTTTYNVKDATARSLLGGHSVGKDVPSDAVFTDTTYTFDGTYNASTNKAATVSTVTSAINALDGGTIGTPGTGKTVTALSQTNGNVSVTFGDISITKSQISDFPSSMTPASHTHGNIQNGGALQTNDVTIASGDKLVVTDSSDNNKVARASIAFDGSTTTKALTPKGTWESFTNNAGTITGITMNGVSKGTSGVVDLGTVITSHQDISGKMNASLKGAANGVAELDSSGKVPSSQLPSYVDDVLEYAAKASFPSAGETGKIYVDKSTNLTWRWSGTAYVEISPSLALGTTSSTAYRGDRGKTAYDHSQSTHARTDATAVAASSTNGNIKINGTETTVYTHPGSGTNPHGTTKSDVGLGNVGNFKAVSTVASQGLTDTEKSNARANIGAGTSSLALGTSSSTAYRGDYGNSAYAHAVTNKGSAFASGLYKITTNSEGHVTAATAVQKSDITGLGIPGSDTNTHRPIQVNGTEVLGNNTTALNLKAGSNVSVTNSSGTVTIAATDTTYSSKTAASGGTDVSLVTTGEKYAWNSKATKPDMATITLSATWSGDGPYTQTVTVSGATVTAASKVDLQPDADGIAQLIEDGVQALYIVNNNGTLTAYSVGAEISTAMTIQCTVTEVVA